MLDENNEMFGQRIIMYQTPHLGFYYLPGINSYKHSDKNYNNKFRYISKYVSLCIYIS